jgi:hypothetical protein
MKPYRVLSWGCGAPSTTLGVLSALGELPRLDAIITADTGWERRRTYEARDWYAEWFRAREIDVEILGGVDIRVEGVKAHKHMPFWTSDGGPLQRQCTRDFKVRPIRRRVRELLGYDLTLPPAPPPGAVEQWLGYTWEEVWRVRESDVAYIQMRYPLIEMRWTRANCVSFLHDRGLPVPVKSACVACPYRDAAEYLEMREQDPEEFTETVEFDRLIRDAEWAKRAGVEADELYVYKNSATQQGEPLESADLEEHAAFVRRGGAQLWLDLCEGPCGT